MNNSEHMVLFTIKMKSTELQTQYYVGEHTGIKTELYQATSKFRDLSIEPHSSTSYID